MAGYRDVWPVLRLRTPTRRGPFDLLAVGRIADDATIATVGQELSELSRRVFPAWRASFQDSSARYVPVPLRKVMLGRAQDTLAVFGAAVGLVLLIVVANVASLTLVRTMARRREMSLRATLGATPTRVMQLLMSESVVLALAGAAVGVALAVLGLHVLAALGAGIPRLASARIGLRAMLFAIGVGVMSGAAAGIYPALVLWRESASRPVGDGNRISGEGRGMVAVRRSSQGLDCCSTASCDYRACSRGSIRHEYWPCGLPSPARVTKPRPPSISSGHEPSSASPRSRVSPRSGSTPHCLRLMQTSAATTLYSSITPYHPEPNSRSLRG
jgi:hypothetical protein